MDVRDSRRLTGPNLLLDGPGTCLDVALDAPGDPTPEACAAAWARVAARLLAAVGWGGAATATATRTFAGGVSLAFAAPVDGLYAACEVNEAAWGMAWAALAGDGDRSVGAGATAGVVDPDAADSDPGAYPADPVALVARLRAAIAAEANPSLVALAHAAASHGVQCLIDPDEVSVGLGTGSRTWRIGGGAVDAPSIDGVDGLGGAIGAVHDAIPDPSAIPWPDVHDVPVALVTGTNGKSTTVRLIAAMVRAAGRVAGVCTTDWVRVGGDVIDEGDWSGPGGARMVLRDARTEIAVLETARGGLLRRGLAVTRADVAAVTNVAADHLGEFGVATVEDLAAVKLVVAKVAGALVLNADDASLATCATSVASAVTWFSLDPQNDVVVQAVGRGGRAVVLDGDEIVLVEGVGANVVRQAGGQASGHDGGHDGGLARTGLATVDEIPIAFGGAARHNVANALCAVGVAAALGLPIAAIRAGLVDFQSSPEDNPGRLNLFDVGGCTVVVDYAHNPHGLRALADVVTTLAGGRRIVVLGQAGDRSDEDLRELATAALAMRPDVVIVKELAEMLRGREIGEVPRVLAAALRGLGVADGAIMMASDEVGATRIALALARAGDVVVLPIHKRRGEVVGLLQRLVDEGWRAGEDLPGG